MPSLPGPRSLASTEIDPRSAVQIGCKVSRVTRKELAADVQPVAKVRRVAKCASVSPANGAAETTRQPNFIRRVASWVVREFEAERALEYRRAGTHFGYPKFPIFPATVYRSTLDAARSGTGASKRAFPEWNERKQREDAGC